jgi:hypothetical protein
VNPGQYTAKLTVNGKTYTQPIVVRQDPRVKTPPLAMQQVYSLSKATYDGAVAAQDAARDARTMRERIAKLQAGSSGPAADALAAFDKKLEALIGQPAGGGRGRGQGGRGAPPTPDQPGTLNSAGAALAGVMNSLQSADVQPTTVQLNAIAAARADAARVMARWSGLRTTGLSALNATLRAAGLETIQP